MPGPRRQSHELPDSLLKESLPENTRDAHVEEMRRLLYVAMTRARKRLVLTWPEATASSGDQVIQKPSPFYEEAREALAAPEETHGEELLGLDENLFGAFRSVRDDLLRGIAQVGDRMNEMRLDAHLDAVSGVARYLELLKLGALIDRRPDQSIGEAITDINRLLLAGVSPQQREAFLASDLDDRLVRAEAERLHHRELIGSTAERSLEAFIPKRGDGVMLSATDIEIYRICPLRYKYARIYAIPREQTLPQRFGILMHQVLERFHSQLADQDALNGDDGGRGNGKSSAAALMTLFEAGWRRGGFGDSNEELQLREKAVDSLDLYYQAFCAQDSTPVWFERSFAFRIGPHLLRGRVDRVDRHPDGSFELIDYKTGKARTPSQLKDDIQLPLYHIGARQSWKLEASRQSYYYLLDSEKVPIEPNEEQVTRIEQPATAVAEGILSQSFEATPSYAACSTCDFRLICPAAEK
jgi:DNA helicase-2/ATP-dependent DNA helicase PcrA